MKIIMQLFFSPKSASCSILFSGNQKVCKLIKKSQLPTKNMHRRKCRFHFEQRVTKYPNLKHVQVALLGSNYNMIFTPTLEGLSPQYNFLSLQVQDKCHVQHWHLPAVPHPDPGMDDALDHRQQGPHSTRFLHHRLHRPGRHREYYFILSLGKRRCKIVETKCLLKSFLHTNYDIGMKVLILSFQIRSRTVPDKA